MSRPLYFLFPGILFALFAPSMSAQTGAKLFRNDRIDTREPEPLRPEWAPFYHGVASGDPLSDRVIIWTRVTPENSLDETIDVTWHMATDTAFTNIVEYGSLTTDATHDFTVKVDVVGLSPNTTYYYSFTAYDKNSLTGRTRTAPTGDQVEHLRFGVVSCSNYQAGYFSAYGRLAERADLDAVIHLGDYIYEYGNFEYGDLIEERPLEPPTEIISLSDYRTRYSTYRLDTNLIRAHQQQAFITVWDDHESANDSYHDGASNHDPAKEGSWSDRKANAMQTYFEWMPVRDNTDTLVHRTLHYGDLMDLIMLDTRLEGREKQIRNPFDPVLQDPDRTILGATQREWFLDQLATSSAKWKIIGQQVIFSPVEFGWAALFDVSPQSTYQQAQGVAQDVWNGYPAERTTIANFLADEAIENVVILTGDFHTSFAFDVSDRPVDTMFTIDPVQGYIPHYSPSDAYDPDTGEGSLAVEFATPSLTSANFNETFDPFVTFVFQSLINKPVTLPDDTFIGNPNPHMKFVELSDHGYYILDVQEDRVQADWFFSEILKPVLTEKFDEAWFTVPGEPFLHKGSGQSPPKPNNPILAPKDPPQKIISSTQKVRQVPGLVLLGNYPNPFHYFTTLNYALQQRGTITADLADATGKHIRHLMERDLPPGLYSLQVEGNDLPPGAYFLVLNYNGRLTTVPLIRQ